MWTWLNLPRRVYFWFTFVTLLIYHLSYLKKTPNNYKDAEVNLNGWLTI